MCTFNSGFEDRFGHLKAGRECEDRDAKVFKQSPVVFSGLPFCFLGARSASSRRRPWIGVCDIFGHVSRAKWPAVSGLGANAKVRNQQSLGQDLSNQFILGTLLPVSWEW
jgi:hypothetical protein